MLDNFYISVFNYYKKRFGKRTNKVALVYINLLEISIYLALATFFWAFSNQMNIVTMAMSKFWIILSLVSIFIIFKNWMRYNGKKRNIIKAKLKAKYSIYLLWLLPLGCLILVFILLQVS
ncbi:hypothetical protein ACPX19_05885 [Winogradskyella sp. HB-48]|uniref:hypothetical protein n=1 Tax=Winogradskyella sp. HB-48 TaxID=3416808 RepID=UPI003CEE5748